jgi:TIR domain
MSKFFISYRRDDSADISGRLHEKLVGHFGPGNVFMDIDAMCLGRDFRKQLADAVNQCDVLLAVIGDRWLDATHQDGPKKGTRRLDDSEDWVRIEIAAALARDIPVVPLLVGHHAAMPRAADLPDDLKELAYRHGTAVRSGEDFPGQADRLVRGLEGIVKAGRIADEDPKMALRRAYEMLELMVRDVYEQVFASRQGPVPWRDSSSAWIRRGVSRPGSTSPG